MKNEEGVLIAGPSGIPIKLKANTPKGYEAFVNTDTNGIASFEGVPNGKYNAYFDEGDTLASDGGLSLYRLKEKRFKIDFTSAAGFILDSTEGFIIESTLVEGYVK